MLRVLIQICLANAIGFALAHDQASAAPATPHELRDCSDCPSLIVVPAGHFTMGSSANEVGRAASEGPQHAVDVPTFAIGKFDVTVAEFDRFVRAASYITNNEKCDWRAPRSHGEPIAQTPDHPVVCISWTDAQAYAAWLSKSTGKSYRLPSEAEWEFAARAGSTTARPWGEHLTRDDANYGADTCCGAFAAGRDRWLNTSPVGQFPPNRFGLYDMLGNVWQWLADCAHDTYSGAPADGSAWVEQNCSEHIVRGGAWFQAPDSIRSAARAADKIDFRIADIGFRVARDLKPGEQ